MYNCNSSFKLIKTYQFFHGFINDVLNFDVMKLVVITELFDNKCFTRGRWTQNAGSKWLHKNDYEGFCKNGSCRFRPMASSPPYRVNLSEFIPNKIESHIEIIPHSFIHCLMRLLVAFNNSITST